MTHVSFPTADGAFLVSFSETGLARLEFPNPLHAPVPGPAFLMNTLPGLWLDRTARALRRALEGEVTGPLPPLDFGRATSFQIAVWDFLRTIRPGRTMTYGQVAAALNRTGAARAVGQACGANPIPLLIPCHRVLASGGRLGGFSCGLEWKEWLLEREGLPGLVNLKTAVQPRRNADSPRVATLSELTC